MTSVSRILCFGVLVSLVLALAPRIARAEDAADERPVLEEPRSRQGYWIGFGVSAAEVQSWEKGRDRGIYSGYSPTFRIGQLITRRIGLGLLIESYGAIKKGSDKGSLYGLCLEASFLTWRDLSVHGGFGLGAVLLKDSQALDPSTRAGGGSYFLVGASYDIFPLKKKLTGGWALTPIVDLHGSAGGDIHFLALLAGVQITFWSGLPDNMLHLPEE
jgi:hypothetical protein